MVGLGIHHLDDQLPQPPGCLAGGDQRAGRVLMQSADGAQALGLERRRPGEQLVEGHPQRIDVAAVVGRLARQLLRRRVIRRADEVGLADARGGRQPEVRHLDVGHSVRRGRPGRQQVGRLHVAVDDAALVGFQQRAGGLDDVLQRFVPAHLPLSLQLIGQRLAAHVLHGEVRRPLEAPDVIDVHHVGVLQPGLGARLQHQPLDQVGAAAQLGPQDLDGHRPLQAEIVGQVDRAHPALAQQRPDLEVIDGAPDQAVLGVGTRRNRRAIGVVRGRRQ